MPDTSSPGDTAPPSDPASGRPRIGVRLAAHQPLARLVERVQAAERLGFASVWLPDDETTGRDLYPTLAACARATARITLAAGVTNTATRHFTVTSCGFASLDERYPGRFILGIGRGDDAAPAAGVQPTPAEQFRADVARLRALLAGESVPYGDKTLRTKFVDPRQGRRVPIYVLADDADGVPDLADGVIVQGGGEVLARGDVPGSPTAGQVVWWAEPGLVPSREQVRHLAQRHPRVSHLVLTVPDADLERLARSALG